MATPTAEQRAAWPPANYVDPVNSHPLILGFVVPLLTLVIVFMGLRMYARGVIKNILGCDDYVMLAAMLFGVPVNIFTLTSLDLGLGLHIWDLKPEWHTPYSKLAYSADLLFPSACSLTKISLCLSYLRLFPNRSSQIFCYVMVAFVTIYTIICLFLSLFQCKPIRGYWDVGVVQQCINMRVTFISIAALNSFSDFCVYLWPAIPLWSLQLPLKQRCALIMLFSVGLLVCVAGVLRMYFLEVYFHSYDQSWFAANVWVVMCIEIDLGIICGCLSGVKPVLQVLLPRYFDSSARSKGPTAPPTCGRSHVSNPHQFPTLFGKSRGLYTERVMSLDEFDKFGSADKSNLAWASSNGHHDAHSMVPANAIGVEQVVMIEQEEPRTITPRSTRPSGKHNLSESSSQEWILHDRPIAEA